MSDTGTPTAQIRHTQMHRDANADNENATLSVFAAEILRYLWDAQEPQTVVQLYDTFYVTYKQEQRDMVSPTALGMTLSGMVKQGLLTVVRKQGQPGRGMRKGYYAPTVTRSEMTVAILEDTCRRLTGQPFSYFLNRLRTPESKNMPDISASEDGLEALVGALKDLQQQSPAT